MKQIFGLISIVGATIIVASPIQPYNGTGTYINLNAGAATTQMFNNTFAVGANAGYNFNRGLAVEGGWTMSPIQQFGQYSSYNIYDAAVRGTLPLTNAVSLYGRLGVAVGYSAWSCMSCSNNTVYHTAGDAWNYGGLAGIGISFTLSRRIDLRVEDYGYLPFSGEDGHFGNTNVISGGLQFNF